MWEKSQDKRMQKTDHEIKLVEEIKKNTRQPKFKLI